MLEGVYLYDFDVKFNSYPVSESKHVIFWNCQKKLLVVISGSKPAMAFFQLQTTTIGLLMYQP